MNQVSQVSTSLLPVSYETQFFGSLSPLISSRLSREWFLDDETASIVAQINAELRKDWLIDSVCQTVDDLRLNQDKPCLSPQKITSATSLLSQSFEDSETSS